MCPPNMVSVTELGIFCGLRVCVVVVVAVVLFLFFLFFCCRVGIPLTFLPSLPTFLPIGQTAFVFKTISSNMGGHLWLLGESRFQGMSL